MSAKLALIIVLLLAARVQARECEVTFHVVPHRFVLQIGNDKGGWDVYQAQSGRPLTLKLSGEMVDFRVEAPGWKTVARQISVRNFTTPRSDGRSVQWPDEGTLQLEPTSWAVWLDYFVRLPSTWMELAGLGALIALIHRFWLAQRRRAGHLQEILRRQGQLEEYRVSATASKDPRLGSLLGDYRIVSRIGAGGMAVVYRAVPNATLDEDAAVAIKILSSTDADFRARFRREVRVCAELNHPNLTRLLDSGEEGGELYLVMEFVDGQTLGKIFREGMPLPFVLSILSQVVAGLNSAHARGVIHRDLKPDNIMITRQARVKVMDFGLAQKFDSTRITAAESIVGTPAYMAPEQLLGEELTVACDQYAFGMLCYEMVCNRLPFTDDNLMAMITQHLTEEPPPPRRFRPDLPEAAEAAILRMLAKKAEGRFGSLPEAWQAFSSGCDLPPD